MGFNKPFFSLPVEYKHLPFTLMTLDDWVLVRVTGSDNEKYLQNQLTVDVAHMKEHQHLIAAHCTPQGKMLSNLHLLRYGKEFFFIERRSLCNSQLDEMKKYAIFSNVFFTIENEMVLLGIAGSCARKELASLFRELPSQERQVVNDTSTVLLWFEYPEERFLLVTNTITAKRITKALDGKAKLNNSQQWLALNIEAGIPTVDIANSGRFIPQAMNMQELGGINFKKGCYIGQETIMQAKCRGTNKRSMHCLIGTGNLIPFAGEDIERKINNNWKHSGTVLAAVRLSNCSLLLQAVVNNYTDPNSVFRYRKDDNILYMTSFSKKNTP